MVKSEEEGSTNAGKVDLRQVPVRKTQQTSDHANQGAKRPADPNPTTNPPPPAKRACTSSALELQISELPGAVRDQVHEEFRDQLPDLLHKEFSKQLPDLLRDLLPRILRDQAPESEGAQTVEGARELREAIRQLEKENRQLREKREKDKAAYKALEEVFEIFNMSTGKIFEVFINKINDLAKRVKVLQQGKATKSAASKEG